MEFLKTFSELNKTNAPIAGGKGASLGEMTNAGIPVPPGFVVLSASFEKFLEETDLDVEIDSILETVKHEDINTVEQASEKIQALILTAKMPEDIANLIQKYFQELGTEYVAVRSSATAEDSASAAWAGQLDSFLNTTEKDLLEKVKRCWASLFTPRAIFYRFEQNLHTQKISVAVVVQKMVVSEVSGIAFSVHPVTQDYNQLIIEAGFGLGEAIVSGQITPDSYVVEKEPRRIIDKNVAEQTRGIFRAIGGGDEWRDIPSAQGNQQKINDEQILELSKIILNIENHYGFPCDIEWAFESGKFYIVQSRPITTLMKKEVREEWFLFEDFDDGTPLVCSDWMNVKRANEFLADLKIESFLTKSLSEYKNGHVYLNFVKKEFDALSKEIVDKISQYPEMFKAVNNDVAVRSNELFAISRDIKAEKLVNLDDEKLFRLFTNSFTKYEYAHISGWIQNAADFGESLLSKYLLGYIKEKISKVSGKKYSANEVFVCLTTPTDDSNAQKEYIDLLKIVSNIQKNTKMRAYFTENNSDTINKELKQVDVKIDQEITNHAFNYGYLGHGLVGPSWNRWYFVDIISSLVRQNKNFEELNKEFVSSKEKLRNDQEKLIVDLAIDANHKDVFEASRGFVFTKGYRKDSMFCYFEALDGLLSEIGKRQGLTLNQLRYIHPSDFERLAKAKITADELDKRFVYSLFYSKGDYQDELILVDEEAANFKGKISFVKTASLDVKELTGNCASPGRARGECRIINTVKDLDKMNQGDILVSIVTSPELVPAMKKAGAIITDAGGITCHAAIVSRELGIPCVIGTKIATKVLLDGTLVDVDATHGRIVIMEKPKSDDVNNEIVENIN